MSKQSREDEVAELILRMKDPNDDYNGTHVEEDQRGEDDDA